MHRVEEIEILQGSFGTSRVCRSIASVRTAAGPKVYIQASLHADETPAMLAAHHLLQRLVAAERAAKCSARSSSCPSRTQSDWRSGC